MDTIRSAVRRIPAAAALAAILALAGCGGGGGNPGSCLGSAAVCSGGSGGGGNGNNSNTGSSGGSSNSGGGNNSGGGSNSGGGGSGSGSADTLFLTPSVPSTSVANICSAGAQKQFVRSYLDEAYLWAAEVPTVNAAPLTPEDYFYQLLVTTPDSHGLPKDRFSFVVSNADADSISTGASYDFGVEWAYDAQNRIRVARVIPGSPADLAGMARGGELVSVLSSSHQTWYPNTPGASVSFTYRPPAPAQDRTITLVAVALQDNPVPLSTTLLSPNGRRVGYVLFNSHSTGAQDKLIPALGALANGGIQDLVLDMRYNGGGYLYTALSLASMVTVPANDGKLFERLQFNAKRAAQEGDSSVFFDGRVQYGEALYRTGTPLPRLGLKRVYVLTTESTCSASESVVNGLRGVDVEVILVGGTTCGKPYGFTRQDNCGLSLYPIEFQGFNAKNYGDYSTGFPANCPAADDFGTALGNPSEGMLGVALRHADSGVCTASTALARAKTAESPAAITGPALALRAPRPGRIVVPLPR